METQNLIELQAILIELQLNGKDNLTEKQQELILRANALLGDAGKGIKNKTMDWQTIASLGLQAAKLVMEILTSSGE